MDFFESSIQNYKIAATSCYIFLFFFVILACARVLLWRLAIALEQMLPAGEVYFRPVMSSKSHRKPRVELIFTLVYSFLDSLLRVSQSLLNSFLYLGKLHWFPSLGQSYFYEPSVFTLRYVGDRISWKTWCWYENDGPGAEMSSRASFYLVYYILWRMNLSKL